MDKVGRNDPCPCGSGKKYKKCCEEKLARKKFNAEVLASGQEGAVTNKAQKISTNFFSRIVSPPTPPAETPAPESQEPKETT